MDTLYMEMYPCYLGLTDTKETENAAETVRTIDHEQDKNRYVDGDENEVEDVSEKVTRDKVALITMKWKAES